MFSVEQILKRFLLRAVVLFIPQRHSSVTELPLDTFRRILIIRQHDQLGDLLIATPAIRAVRRKFPDAFVALVAREYTAALLERNPHLDQVIVFYEKLWRWNLRKLYTFWRTLRGQGGFDCAIVLNTVSRSLSSDLVALLSKARFIVGPDHLSLDSTHPERIYNVISRHSPDRMTEIERNLEILYPLGATVNDFEYDLILSDEEVSRAEKIFAALKVAPGKIVAGVHCGALNPSKVFPLKRLVSIIDWLVERYRAEIVLVTSEREKDRKEFILSQVRQMIHTAPPMPLRVAAAFMRQLDLLLCNDTGVLHIAASQRIPTVSFHSLSDPKIWKPPQPRHVALRASDEQITSISIDEVQRAVAQVINGFVRNRPLDFGARR